MLINMKAKWNNKEYKIINSVGITESSREVTYTDLVLDFAKCTIEDLPLAQQEVQIIDKNSNLLFTGFVADYKLPELNRIKTPKKELTLSLFSPRQMATKRTMTIIRTAKMSEIITQVLSPLYQDGFNLKEINIEDKTITINLISRTIEEILNYFSNKYSLYWNIDELKNITINSIEYMLNKEVKKSINLKNYKEEIKGLLSITPEVENIDYGNIINVKNARIFYDNVSTDLNITLKNGDRIDFENPIDVSFATGQRVAGELATQGVFTIVDNLTISYNGNQEAYIRSNINSTNEVAEGLTTKDIAKDDSSNALFTLTMDSTFKNLATGITYKGTNNITLNGISSQTYLRYANMKLINWREIERNQGKITPSGQIEKILDVENGWFTVQELIDYVRNTLKNNEKYTNKVTLKYDEENDIQIGDRLNIELPEYFISGNFIVTDKARNKEKTNPIQYSVTLRNTNLFENFIDLFRNSSDLEEQQSQTELEYIVEYAEEETIKETHQILIDENYSSTLDFMLRG